MDNNDEILLSTVPKLEDKDRLDIIFGNFIEPLGNAKVREEIIRRIEKHICFKNKKRMKSLTKKIYHRNLILIKKGNNYQFFRKEPKFSRIGKGISVDIFKIYPIENHCFPIKNNYDYIEEEDKEYYIFENNSGKTILNFIKTDNKLEYFIKLSVLGKDYLDKFDKNIIGVILEEIS